MCSFFRKEVNMHGTAIIGLGSDTMVLVASRDFNPGEEVLDYTGELIQGRLDITKRQDEVEEPIFVWEFKFKDKLWAIDGTTEEGLCGRLVKHNIHPNLRAKVIPSINPEKPRLILVAKEQIESGETLYLDYGDCEPRAKCKRDRCVKCKRS